MRLSELMEKNDQKKLQLLHYLDQHPNQRLRNSELQHKLDISYYLFKRRTKEIADDIDTFQLSGLFDIEVTDTTTTLHKNHNTNIFVFLNHYLERSYQIKILMLLVMQRQNFDLYDFAEAHYVSYTFMYKRFTALRQTLQKWGINLNNNSELTGDELAIRLLLAELIIITHVGEETFDNEIRTALHELLELIDTPVIAPSMSQLIETKAYLLASLLRFQQGYFVATSPEVAKLISKIRQQALEERSKVIAIFQTHFPADEQAINNECDYLGTFLAIVGIISAPAVIFPDEVTQRSSDFIRGFEERFGVTLTLEAKQNITYEVDKCWIDVVAFPLRSGFFEYHTEIAYFARTFPEFFEYCQTYVQQQEAALDDQQAQFIFYRCLLTLVANVPLSSVLEPLYVCVDFTLGEAYNTIIERGIKRFSMLNVKVTNEVQPKTRLIITDLVNAYRHTDIPKVIWLSPPRAEDWEHLISELLAFRLVPNGV